MNSVQLWPYSISVYFLQVPSDQSLLVGMFTRSSYRNAQLKLLKKTVFFKCTQGIFLLGLPAFTIQDEQHQDVTKINFMCQPEVAI